MQYNKKKSQYNQNATLKKSRGFHGNVKEGTILRHEEKAP